MDGASDGASLSMECTERLECCVCFHISKNVLMCITPCKHTICMECILHLKEYACPLCRMLLPKNSSIMKARGLFTRTKQSPAAVVLPLDDHVEFPHLGV